MLIATILRSWKQYDRINVIILHGHLNIKLYKHTLSLLFVLCFINQQRSNNKNHLLTLCFLFLKGIEVTRIELGLPTNWHQTAITLNRKPIVLKPYEPKSSMFKKKCPEIRKLDNYEQSPPTKQKPWRNFYASKC